MRKKRSLPLKRHSTFERNVILDRFEEACASGASPSVAADGLSASLASIYRWQRERNPSRDSPLATYAQRWTIDAAIARLADESDDDKITLLEALFKFVAWLNWPHLPNDHPAGITACAITYVTQREPVTTLNELSMPSLTLIHRNLRLDTLRRMCSDNFLTLPWFEPLTYPDEEPLEDETGRTVSVPPKSQLLSDIAWFSLSYVAPTKDRRDAVSLNKAHYAMQRGAFGYRWRHIARTFRALWLTQGVTAPFLYVERHHPTFQFILDPTSERFAQQVDEMVRQRSRFTTYLARCASAIRLLESRLDRRALTSMNFPKFPASIPNVKIKPPALPILIKDAMRGFGRQDSR